MRAILLASATAASFGVLRSRSSRSQPDPRLRFPLACLTTEVAPTTSSRRKLSSPARVILPSLVFPAVKWSFGVKPSQAANSRPERKACGVRRLHHQRCGGNWANARDLRQPPAQGIGTVPGHELCLDRLQFDLHLRIVASERCKQLARQYRYAFVVRNRGQERCDLVQTFGFDQPELRCITADRVAQLRTPCNQLVADA